MEVVLLLPELVVPSNPTVSEDGSVRLSNPSNINFTGNVTVTNRGSGTVEVNVPESSGLSLIHI